MEKIMAVISRESKYAERFCEYINQKDSLAFTAVPFEDIGSCANFAEQHKLELLLADPEFIGSEPYGMKLHGRAGHTLVLDDGGAETEAVLSEISTYVSGRIRKYQSAEQLVRSIMESCEGLDMRKTSASVGRPVRILGVYSPCDRTGSCAFALALARIADGSRPALYLNFSEFSGLSKLTGEEFTSSISDAFYHLKQGTLTPEKLHSMIYRSDGIDYLPPVRFAEDKEALNGNEYAALISMILSCTTYDSIVIDMQSFAGEASELMDLCDLVYMPLGADRLSDMQTEECMDYLTRTGREGLLQKISKVRVPDLTDSPMQGSFIDSLIYGPLGDVVRGLEGGRE